jgi:methylated-DNA-[protein]-cysteine S-methyltransferase
MYTDYIDSPLGILELKASNKGIAQVIFSGEEKTQGNPN